MGTKPNDNKTGDPAIDNDTTGKGPAPTSGDISAIEKEQKPDIDADKNEGDKIVDGKKTGTVMSTDTSDAVAKGIADPETGGLTNAAIDADLDQDRRFQGGDGDDDGEFKKIADDELEEGEVAHRPDPLDSDDLVQHPGQVYRNKTDGKVAYAPPGTYNAAMAGVQQDASGHFESIGKINSDKSGTRV